MPANPRTEPVSVIVGLLTTDWAAANTDGETPVIRDGAGGQKDRRSSAGWVQVYQDGQYVRDRNDVAGAFKTHRVPVTVEVHAGSRAKLNKLLGEVERIFNLRRNNPDAYWDWLEDLGEQPLGQFPEATWTRVLVELVANSIAVAE